MRVTYLWGAFWIVNVFIHLLGSWLLWLVGLVLSVTSLVLLRLSGGRFVRRGTSWYWDGEIGQNVRRDVIWRRRR